MANLSFRFAPRRVEKGKYYEILEIRKMYELGNIQHAVNPWAVINPWDTEGIQSTSKSSRYHVYDDAAAAAVSPWAVSNPWDTEETQPTIEIYTFTLKQIVAEADKALRGQGNLAPRRALDMLRDILHN